jgi:hypothetical protein
MKQTKRIFARRMATPIDTERLAQARGGYTIESRTHCPIYIGGCDPNYVSCRQWDDCG